MRKVRRWLSGKGSAGGDGGIPPYDVTKFPPLEGAADSLPAPVTGVVVGAGSRGAGYARYALERPDLLKIVGVADPRKECTESLAHWNKIPEENVFTDWKEAADREKFADFVYIATPDRLHKEPAVAFANKGYHILLEKPMAVSEEECESIAAACKENQIILAVCHVYRYLPQCRRIKTLIDEKAIGDVVNIQLMEPVGYWHFAHSYVRGNWHREEDSTFSLMAKSCHDIDLINYWMSPRKCVKVSSFGTLAHFSKDQKPEGAGSRCIDCSIEESCPYSAKRLYMSGNKGWPVSVICKPTTSENIEEALASGPYGKCVYECDNDVMSNQTVQFEYEGARLATFTMIAFTSAVGMREVSVYGTRGEIRASLSGSKAVIHTDFVTGQTVEYNDHDVRAEQSVARAHGGADYFLINSFIRAVAATGNTGGDEIMTGPDDTLASHKLVFAAERSRRENKVVTL